jgi:hypothetical protein
MGASTAWPRGGYKRSKPQTCGPERLHADQHSDLGSDLDFIAKGRVDLLDLAAGRFSGLVNRNRRSSLQWRDHGQVGATNLIREGLKRSTLAKTN